MKKFFILSMLFAMALLTSFPAYAYNEQKIAQAVDNLFPQYRIFKAVEKGDLATLRKEVAGLNKDVLLQRHSVTGNNVFHLAHDLQTFSFLWNLMSPKDREVLLTQKNKQGEIPFLRQLMYNHADIVANYLPQTDLYIQLEKTTPALRYRGLNLESAKAKRDNLIKLCSNNSGFTMWQAADTWVKQPGDPDSSRNMRYVRDTLKQIAPFLIKK